MPHVLTTPKEVDDFITRYTSPEAQTERQAAREAAAQEAQAAAAQEAADVEAAKLRWDPASGSLPTVAQLERMSFAQIQVADELLGKDWVERVAAIQAFEKEQEKVDAVHAQKAADAEYAERMKNDPEFAMLELHTQAALGYARKGFAGAAEEKVQMAASAGLLPGQLDAKKQAEIAEKAGIKADQVAELQQLANRCHPVAAGLGGFEILTPTGSAGHYVLEPAGGFSESERNRLFGERN
jgi:hypothetical protein